MTSSAGPYRDSSGKTLAEYEHPSTAVDTALLTVADRRLQVVLADSDGELRLPGTFLHVGEVLADAVRRSLADKVGIVDVQPEQLHVFDELGRDDRGWVLSVAHVAVVRAERLPRAGTFQLTPVDALPRLKYDHGEIIKKAVVRLRAAYDRSADPQGLLLEEFTLLELQHVHEAVAGKGLSKDVFRRRVIREDQVVPVGRTSVGTIGKPARIFRRA